MTIDGGPTLWIVNHNNLDIRTLGATVVDPSNWRSIAGQTQSPRVVGASAHALYTAPQPKVDGRSLSFTLIQTAADGGNLQTNKRHLQTHFYFGELQLSFVDETNKAFFCKVRSFNVRAVPPPLDDADPAHFIDVVCEMEVPYLQAINESVIDFTVAKEIPTGNAPSETVVRLTAAASTTGTFTLKDMTGATRQTMTLTVPTGQTWIEADSFAETVTDSAGASQVDALSGRFIRLRPEYADLVKAPPDYQTLEVSTGNGRITYRESDR